MERLRRAVELSYPSRCKVKGLAAGTALIDVSMMKLRLARATLRKPGRCQALVR